MADSHETTGTVPSGGSRYNLTSRRRRFLQGLGGGMALTLAGCTQGGTGDGDLSNVTINFWDIMAAQGQVVQETIRDLINQFQDDTGVRVRVNWSGYGPLYGQKWVTQFTRGDYPVIYDAEFIAMGKLYATGHILPFSEYQDRLDQDIVDNIEWMLPFVEDATRFWPDGPYGIPWGLNPRTPFVIRTDHFEEAGLSVEDDFPPENYDHLMSLARTLQNDGPTDVGFPVYGDGFDTIDTFDSWRAADSERYAHYVNEDGTEPLYQSDPWVTNVERMVAFEEEGLATGRSVSLSDENARDLLAAGQISMAQIEYFNVPVQFRRSEDLLMDGTLKYGRSWSGDTGKPAVTLPQSMGITRAPPDADEDEWERRQEAAIQFMNRWFGKEFQRQLPQLLGLWPVRRDVWDEVEIPGEENHNIGTSLRWMSENMSMIQPTMVNGSAVAYTIISSEMQQVYQGNKSVAQALSDAEEQALEVLQQQ